MDMVMFHRGQPNPPCEVGEFIEPSLSVYMLPPELWGLVATMVSLSCTIAGLHRNCSFKSPLWSAQILIIGLISSCETPADFRVIARESAFNPQSERRETSSIRAYLPHGLLEGDIQRL